MRERRRVLWRMLLRWSDHPQLQVLLIDQPHQLKVVITFTHRLIVITGAGQTQRGTLLSNTHTVATLNLTPLIND